jgi:hypothetical protein
MSALCAESYQIPLPTCSRKTPAAPSPSRTDPGLGPFRRDGWLCSLFCHRQGEKAVAGKILPCLSSRPAFGRGRLDSFSCNFALGHRRLDSPSCTFAHLGRTLGPQPLLLAHQPHRLVFASSFTRDVKLADGLRRDLLREWCHGGGAYVFRGTNDSKGGIEKDVVKECSGGWVPSRMAFARISIACPVSGGM